MHTSIIKINQNKKCKSFNHSHTKNGKVKTLVGISSTMLKRYELRHQES